MNESALISTLTACHKSTAPTTNIAATIHPSIHPPNYPPISQSVSISVKDNRLKIESLMLTPPQQTKNYSLAPPEMEC